MLQLSSMDHGRNLSAGGYQDTMLGDKYEQLCVGASWTPPHIHQNSGVRGAHSRTPRCMTVGGIPI